jgi:hypothetical protein
LLKRQVLEQLGALAEPVLERFHPDVDPQPAVMGPQMGRSGDSEWEHLVTLSM